MYAVVEFEKRKCAIVPLNWLTDDQQKCYWPKAISTKAYDKMVADCKEPSTSWSKFDVIKLFRVIGDYDAANSTLQKVIEESCSGTSDTDNQQADALNILQPNEIAVEPINPNKAASRKRNSSSDEWSSEDFSDHNENTLINNSSLSSTITLDCSTPGQSTSELQVASPALSSHNCMSSNMAEVILRKLEHLISAHDQQMLLLNNILSTHQATLNNSLNKPSDIPNLPVNNKAEYKTLEDFLKNEDKFNYMKCRLACIGGTGVRNAVMNMMKFVLSDKVAMKFNWAGRDHKKRAFRDSLISKVIQEGIMTAFSKHGAVADLTDKCIQDAMKDWLKLAKHRFENKAKKSRTN